MTKQTAKTEVIVQEPVKEGLPAIFGEGLSLDDIAQDSGHGLQNITAQDIATPLLYVLQSNSGQVKRSDGRYISGAVEGQIFNNVTMGLIDGSKGIIVVPCYFEKVFIEWKPDRGGFVAIHSVDTDLRDKIKIVEDAAGKQIPTIPNGNSLIETNQHYVLVLHDDGSFEAAVIPMTSSFLKASRIWNALQKKVVLYNSKGQPFIAPSYYSTYKMTTKSKTKDQYSWYVWNIEPNGPVATKELYGAGKDLEKAVSSGKVKVKMDDSLNTTSETSGVASSDDDSIPFD
jgi:hypothetical protein